MQMNLMNFDINFMEFIQLWLRGEDEDNSGQDDNKEREECINLSKYAH